MRVKFRKGMQREFIKKVLRNINSLTLSELSNRMQISYSTLKNYFNESRSLPEALFNDLRFISGINFNLLNMEILNDNWGQVIGGKKGKKKLLY